MLCFCRCQLVLGDSMKKIFIASNEEKFKILLSQTLNYSKVDNMELIMPENQEEFQYIIKREVPDVIFIDVRLNSSLHIELMELLEKDETLEHCYKILLTEKFNYSKERELWQNVIDLCIYTPFDPEYLIQKTSTLLNI